MLHQGQNALCSSSSLSLPTDVISPRIEIIMGSDSDYNVMKEAANILNKFGVSHEMRQVSAHRTTDLMISYAKEARNRGVQVIIAGAGGAAHLPGMVAASTPLPVIGVPISSSPLNGLDSLLSIVQMPRGVPVATVGIDNATNAGLLAMNILGDSHSNLQDRMADFEETKCDVFSMDVSFPRVGIIMELDSDPLVEDAARILNLFGVLHEIWWRH